MSETRQGWRVLAVLSILLGFASISTDLFLPAIPTIATALKAAPGTIELTISSYLVGFSVGQVLWGPIGDRHGRRGPIAAGLVLFIVGSPPGVHFPAAQPHSLAGGWFKPLEPAQALSWPARWCAISTRGRARLK